MVGAFVYSQLYGMKVYKSIGLDGISARFLKDAAALFTKPAKHIINVYNLTKIVPNKFKEAWVRPLFNKFGQLMLRPLVFFRQWPRKVSTDGPMNRQIDPKIGEQLSNRPLHWINRRTQSLTI